MSAFKFIKERVNIVTEISHHIGLTEGRSGVWRGCCPFHHDTKPSLTVSEHYKNYRCWVCDIQGDVLDFTMRIRGFSEPLEAVSYLADKYNLTLPNATPTDHELVEYSLMNEDMLRLFRLRLSKSDEVKTHLASRGLSRSLDMLEVGYCGATSLAGGCRDYLKKRFPTVADASKIYHPVTGDCIFSGRVVFPIRDASGRLLAFAGRALDSSIKYLNTHTNTWYNKGDILYNWSRAKHYPEVYVVEGYTDVASLMEAGIDNAVAVCTAHITPAQLSLLSTKRIILALDNDDTGRRSMANFCQTHSYMKFEVVKPYGYGDANELLIAEGPQAVATAFNNKYSNLEYFLEYLRTTQDLSTLDGREEVYQKMTQVLDHSSEVVKDYYVKRVCRLLGLKRR